MLHIVIPVLTEVPLIWYGEGLRGERSGQFKLKQGITGRALALNEKLSDMLIVIESHTV